MVKDKVGESVAALGKGQMAGAGRMESSWETRKEHDGPQHPAPVRLPLLPSPAIGDMNQGQVLCLARSGKLVVVVTKSLLMVNDEWSTLPGV